jgi:hypothetical protein
VTHQHAKKELEAGTPAELICATCPWDRLCVEPPSMSEQEVKRQIDEAAEADRARDPEQKSMPVGALMTALTLGGRDSAGKLCPVFALRLRGPDGRQLADGIRTQMRSWGEQ